MHLYAPWASVPRQSLASQAQPGRARTCEPLPFGVVQWNLCEDLLTRIALGWRVVEQDQQEQNPLDGCIFAWLHSYSSLSTWRMLSHQRCRRTPSGTEWIQREIPRPPRL